MVGINYLSVLAASITASLFLILVVIVLIANPKSSINRLFVLYLTSSYAWGVFTAFGAWNTTPTQEFIFNRLLNTIGVFGAAIFYLFFSLAFLRKPYKHWLLYVVPTYIFFSYLMWFTPLISSINDTPLPHGTSFHGRNTPGPLLQLSIAWGASLIGILFFYLIKDWLTSKDKFHLQKVKLVTLATVIGAGSGLIFNAFPVLWKYPVDLVGQFLAAAVLTYAILRFELVDVSTKFRNILVEVIFTGLLASLFLAFVFGLQTFLGRNVFLPAVIAAIFITSLSRPIKDRVLKFVDVTFYRTRYDYRETINKFIRKAGEILDFQSLSDSITKTVKETFGAKDVQLLVLYKNAYRSLNSKDQVSFEISDPLVNSLKRTSKVLGKEDLGKIISLNPKLNKSNLELITPLKNGEDLVGILLVQERLSGDYYSSEDKNLIFTLAQSSAIALKNALLYQEVLERKEEIEKLLETERDLNQSKDQFINIASHYLRAPITSMKGYLDLLLRSGLMPREREEYLKRAYNEEQRLSTIVEDLITISSLEKGQLRLFFSKVNVKNLIEKVITDFEKLADEKKLYLKSSLETDLEVEADYQRISQAISNLVDNAIKSTNSGGITVKTSEEDTWVKICVEDTGIGITQEQLNLIFQNFYQVEDSKTFNYPGSGLGLYIAKLIAQAHRGRVEVTSTSGKGSVFCLYLPKTHTIS